MPIHQLLAGRFSCRDFKPEPISDADLRLILEAGRWAPSSYNDQPWTFLVAKRENPEAFQKMLACTAGNQEWTVNASVILACCAVKTYRRSGKPHRHAWHDIGLAVMAMAVQGVAQGLQMCEMAGIEAELVRRTYGVPETHDVVTCLAIGRPASMPPEGKRARKPLSEFVFEGGWGKPLPGLP